MRRLALVALCALAAACAPDTRSPQALVEDIGPVAALAPTEGGGLRFGELRTGTIRTVSSRGVLEAESLATLEVSTQGHRGLLGLAIDGKRRMFAAWTRPDGVLMVGEVLPGGGTRPVWEGPESRDRANGGHIAFLPDGGLLVGIGDLYRADLVDDPDTVNGKILRLDPDGEANQPPEVVSSGWYNPFAFTVTPSGRIWVADNSPGARPERLADSDRGVVLDLPARTVPAGLVAVGEDLLVLCGYTSRVVQPYRLTERGPAPEGRPRATDCRYGVSVLADGRVVYAAPGSLRTVRL